METEGELDTAVSVPEAGDGWGGMSSWPPGKG